MLNISLKKALTLTLLGSSMVTTNVVSAHDFWLLPSSTVLSGDNSWITVDAAVSNDKFHVNYRPLQLDNLVITGPDGKPVQAQNMFKGQMRSGFDVELTEPGTYQLALVNGGIAAFWKEDGKNRRWMGPAEKFDAEVPKTAEELRVTQRHSRIETFATRGKPTDIPVATEGLGLKPVTHPNDLYAGEPARFVVLLDGQPAANIDVEVVRGAQRYRDTVEEIMVKSNAAGEVEITWPQAGQYWVHLEHSDDKTRVKQAKTRNLSYTATLEVLPQ